MPRIKGTMGVVTLLFMGVMALAGCSDSSNVPGFDPESGHPGNWVDPGVHGQAAIVDPGSCTPCHGSDFLGGISGVSCDECHLLYPHARGYDDPLVHGEDARADILDCKVCHATGIDYDGKNTGVDCKVCHGTTASGAPHPSAWIVSGNSTHIFRIGIRTGCEECHIDIPDESPCGDTSICHQGGANLP